MAQHKINAQLYDNELTENPNSFIARVPSERSLNTRDVAELTVKKGSMDMSAEAMEHAVNAWLKEMASLMCDGFSINTGLFTSVPRIKGSFESLGEKFNPAKHSIVFDMRHGMLLKKELANVEVNITGMANTSGTIAQVKDVKTGSVNSVITPSRNLCISGSKLKIVGNSDINGVWFIDSQTASRVKVEASDIVSNKPSELIVIVPELKPGTYRLEVTTQYTTGALLKESRTAAFDKLLAVS